jgi:hypothetical protein
MAAARDTIRRRLAPLAALVGTALAASAAIAALNFAVDPYGLYRSANACLSVPCVPREFVDYLTASYVPGNAIITGSSLTDHSDLARSTEAHGGGRLINLSGIGTSAPQQAMLVDRSLGWQHIRSVYWELYTNLMHRPGDVSPGFPAYAFTATPLDDYPYLLSIETTRSSVETLSGLRRPRLDAADLQAYHDCACRYDAATMKADVPKFARVWDVYLDLSTWQPRYVKAVIERDILPVVRSHPDVEFVFFFPPVSIYNILEIDIRLAPRGLRFIDLKRAAVEALLDVPNVRLVDFQIDETIVTDFDLYSDTMHYSPDVNVWVVRNLRADGHRIDRGNLDARLDALSALATRFRPEYLAVRSGAADKGASMNSPR